MDARSIIAKWPTRQILADDIGGSLYMIHSWVKRNRIAPEHDVAIVRAAQKREIPVTYEDLAVARACSACGQGAQLVQDSGGEAA